MKFTTEFTENINEIIAVFEESFAASEGADEGALIAKLVSDMLSLPSDDGLLVCSVIEHGQVCGCILFSPIAYPKDPRAVYILSPVAVAPSVQGRGVGTKLIDFGLDHLRVKGAEVVLTYGDITFYRRVGFHQIAAEDAPPPFPLSYPHGWLGQSLKGESFAPLIGPSRCVAPLNDPAFW